MSPAEATMLLPAPAWRDPRVHLLDDAWLLTIFAILLAAALPWAVSGFEIDPASAAMGLLALGAIHVAFTMLINPARAPGAWRGRVLSLLHAIGIVCVGFIWHQAGGLQNPAFLLVFVMPVVGAIFLSRWQPYLMAVIAVLTVATVALLQAPELRWYASGLNAAGGWIAALFGSEGATQISPFPGLYAPSSYFVVMLEVFAVLLFACAVAAEYLGTVFERLHEQVLAARIEAERGQELWATLIEHLPLPALLVDAHSMQVIYASHSVAPAFGTDGAPAAGRRLFEAIEFTYPEVIQELIAGAGGIAPLSMIRVGAELRAAEVRVEHIAQRGRRFALMIIEDRTEALCLRTALDVADYASLVVDSRAGVLAFNKPACALFAGIEVGADASRLLAQPEADAAQWWEPTLKGRLKMHVEIMHRLYQMTSSAVALPGEEEKIYVVAFRPVARTAAADRTSLSPTLVQSS